MNQCDNCGEQIALDDGYEVITDDFGVESIMCVQCVGLLDNCRTKEIEY